jgi:hypothetical protein
MWAAMSLGLTVTCACERHAPPSAACTAPRTYWQQPHNTDGLSPVQLQVSIDHNSFVYVQGGRVTVPELQRQLRGAAAIHNPDVIVALDTEMGASCGMLEKVRDAIDQAMDCRASGRCAEGSRIVWKNWPLPPGTPPS